MRTTFDPTKPVRTRHGRAARIICADVKSGYPIIALVANSDDGTELARSYDERGLYYSVGEECGADLINVPERKTEFLNMGSAFISAKVAAEKYRNCPVLEVTFEGDEVVETKLHPALRP